MPQRLLYIIVELGRNYPVTTTFNGLLMVFTLPDLPTREDTLKFLSKSASYGNLGAFIGAGFSKAVLNDDDSDEIALSWGNLLQQASKKLNVDYNEIGKEGLSYPDIASAICKVHSEITSCGYAQSLVQLKSEIS